MAWICEGCKKRDESDNLNFPVMHEAEGHHVVPDTQTALRWGAVLGAVTDEEVRVINATTPPDAFLEQEYEDGQSGGE